MVLALELPDILNGTVEVGISAGVDDFFDEKFVTKIVKAGPNATGAHILDYGGTLTKIDLDSTLAANWNEQLDLPERKLWMTVLLVIVSQGWFLEDDAKSNRLFQYVPFDAGTMATTEADAVRAEINSLGFLNFTTVATILVAAKITWFMTNHHVGQDPKVIHGYVGKCVAAQAMNKAPYDLPTVRSIIWSAGKIMSTKAILAAIDIKGINYDANLDPDRAYSKTFKIKLADDALLRTKAFPSGTGRFAVSRAILTVAKASGYSVFLPNIEALTPNPNRVEEVAKEILDAQAEYHVGAKYLTGSDRKKEDPFTDDDVRALACFIHALRPGGTLAKSPSVIDKKEVQSDDVYTKLVAVKTSMANVIGNREAALILQAVNGGVLSKCLGTQVGRVTQTALDDIIKKAQADLAVGSAVPFTGF